VSYPRRLYFIVILATWCALCCGCGQSAAQAIPRAVDRAFQLTAERAADRSLVLSWTIAPGYYLYHDHFAVATGDGRVLSTRVESGEEKDDPNFGPVEIHRDAVRARVEARDLPASGAVTISYQGCAEQGICLPPVRKTLDLATLKAIDNSERAAPSHFETLLAASPALLFVSFLGFGLLLALTPCVFPMIPILSGVVAGAGGLASPARALLLSGSYVLAMAAAYASLGVAAAWTGQNLQIVFQAPAAVIFMSAIFVVLALSMFGLFEFQLPGAWTRWVMRAPAGKGGSLTGAALLGFGSSLIVGPCVTPPLAAALLYVARTGDIMRGALALFALGLGMGLPMIAFGVLGARMMPKSGPWLAKAKNIFGFMFLGMAVWMSGRIVSESLVRTVGFALAAGGVLSLFPVRRPDRLVARLTPFILVLTAAASAAWFSREQKQQVLAAASEAGFERVVGNVVELDAALAAARSQSRPILIDFTAAWCSLCREIEGNVLSNPEIGARLKGVSIIRADVTDYSSESQALMQRFSVVGPPTLVVLDPENGREIEGGRSIGALTIPDFKNFLDRAGA
jgi:thioredoxin:protein disulfide reductase